ITGRISEFQRRSLMAGPCFGSSSEVCSRQLHAARRPWMKILVVDDHVLIREALRGVLRELKGEVVILEASTGGEAMRIIAKHADLGLVLWYLNLPDRDGFSILDELNETHPEIPVVVLSGQQDSDSVARALDQG